jgi:hypothetical protein
MGVNMRSIFLAVLFAIGILVTAILFVDAVNAKETTTLEDALERPVVLERRYDKDTGVVCYWAARHPEYIACVQVIGLNLKQYRKLLNDTRD